METPYFGTAYEVTDHFLDHDYLQFYLGTCRSPTKICSALFKCLNMQTLPNWSVLQQFTYETELLSQLNHPNLPLFLEQKEITDSTGQNWICLIQERLPGQNLKEKYVAAGQLTLKQVTEIAAQTLRILTALHRSHPAILHLDIKPSNLLQDNKGTVYLIDFGSAMRQGEENPLAGGTPGFSPAEQLSGQSTPQSDLYALGATCIELLSGHAVTSFLTGHQIVFWEHLSCEPVIKNWLEIMVHPDPQLRFDNANQALEQLLSAVESYAPTEAKSLQKLKQSIPDELMLKAGISGSEFAHLTGKKPVLKNYVFLEKKSSHGAISTWTAKKIAPQSNSDQLVIVKQLNIPDIENLNAFTQFEREIKNLENLKNPCFPELLDFIKQEHRWFMVQNFLPGISLTQKVNMNWNPEALELCELAESILTTLQKLHHQKPSLIHRDLQPDHILIDVSLEKVYLLGFGGAQQRFMSQGSGGSTRTGSFGYTAPEQYVGQHNPASDLFGVGMCLLYVLRKRSPATYTWENQQLKLDDLTLPEGIQNWLKRMTHLDPKERPASAKDALAALFPHYEELKAKTRSKNYASKKVERIENLREAEQSYTNQAIAQQESDAEQRWGNNPWISTLKALNLPLPPTLRLELGQASQYFEVKIPGATESREPYIKWTYFCLQIYTGLSLVSAAMSMFFLPLLLPFILALVLHYLFHKKLSVYLHHLHFSMSNESLTWQRLANKKWPLQSSKKRHTLEYEIKNSYFKVVPMKAPVPLAQTYYTIQCFSNSECTDLRFKIDGVLLLNSEEEWLNTVLNSIIHQL